MGGAGSTLIGDRANIGIQPEGGALQGTTNEYGGNIIIDTAGVKNAYGSAVTVSFVNEGISGTDSGTQKTDGNTFTFHGNAFYTKALDAKSAIYGTTQALTISAKGSDSTVLTQQSPATVDNSGHFDNNHVNFGPQTIYSNGIIYGNMETFNLNVQTGNTVEEQHMSGNGFYSGVVDISGSIQGNTFTFAPNYIMIQGDTASSGSSTVYANLKSLLITIQQTVPPANNPNMTVAASSTFKDNTFIFGDSVLDASKNAGMFASFYGHITDFGSLSNPKDYHGFIDGNIEVKTVGVGADAHLVTTDVNNNAIIWGNNTYTGGVGTDIYNFRLLADDNQVVFTGFDTIKNLDAIPFVLDILSFKVDDNLFRLLDTSGDLSISAEEMDAIATFTHGGHDTTIHFDGGGSLFLENIYATSFSQLPFAIDALPTVNASAVFNPVFITGSRSGIFDDFIKNIDPSDLTYTAVGLPSGMTLSTNGALNTTVSGIVDAAITVTASNQNVSLKLPTFHVFALNTANEIITSSTDTVSGSKDAQAFNVKGSIVYGGEDSPLVLGNANVLYGSKLINNMGTTPHTIYGDVSSIKNDTASNIARKTFTFDHNLLNIKGDGPVNSDNLIPDQIYGNVKTLSISTPVSIYDNFFDNTFNFKGNTIYGTGDVYGNMRTLTFDGTSGAGDISSNTFNFGPNHLTEGAYLNGSNTLTDNNGATTLYAGIGSLKLPDSSNIYNNHLVYGDSGLISHETGITNFYGDIGDLTSTTFYTQMVTATSFSNHVNVADIRGNEITWGNVTMNGSSVGTDIFNFNLLLSNTHDIVMQGNASINNFTMGQDMLTLHLSDALYQSLQLANPTSSSITASMLDTFDNNLFNLGSITLNGNQVTTLADLGTNVAVKADITPMDGISNPETIIQGTANADTFYINASGNSIDSFKELSHLIDFSGSGSVSDTLQLNFSEALFKSLGLSDSNSSAQNFDHLLNAAHTDTGGIAMTTTATDTILTFTSSAGNYGSITLHNVALDPVINPIQNHLLITHS